VADTIVLCAILPASSLQHMSDCTDDLRLPRLCFLPSFLPACRYDDDGDEELLKLIPFLEKVASTEDVRPHIQVRAAFSVHDCAYQLAVVLCLTFVGVQQTG
jgi:hypothetical protein